MEHKISKKRCLITILLILFSVYKIHLGLHFDESLNVTMGDMFLKNKGFLCENWSTLQFTGIFIAPFLWIYKNFIENMVGMILFLRYVYLIIQALVAWFTYKTVKKYVDERNAWITAVCVYVFVLSWQAITYKSVLFWGCLLLVLCLIRYYNSDKIGWLILAALALCMAILGFVGAIAMTIPAIYLLYKKNNDIKPVLLFLTTCFLSACVLFGYALAGNTLESLIIGIKQVLHADSYPEPLVNKIIRIGGSIFIIGVISTILYKLTNQLLRKFHIEKIDIHKCMAGFALLFFAIICVLRPQSISASRVWYVLTVVFFFIYCDSMEMVSQEKISREKRDFLLTFFYFPGIFMMISIMIATNEFIIPVVYGGILGLVGLVAIYPDNKLQLDLKNVTVMLLLLAFVAFIPDQSGKDHLIQVRECIDIGPAKGIYISSDELNDYNRVCDTVIHNVSDDDLLLITGNNYKSNGYLCSEAGYGIYSSFNVGVDTPKLYEYYSYNLDRLPSVILYDTKGGMELADWLNTDIGQMISGHFDLSEMVVYDDYYVLRR